MSHVPERGHPLRPIILAVNTARAMAFVCVGVCVVLSCLFVIFGGFKAPGRFAAVFLGTQAVLFWVPGVTYFILSRYLDRRRPTPFVVTICIASLHVLGLVLLLVLSMATMELSNMIMFGVPLVVGVLLIVYCAQAMSSLKQNFSQQYGLRGFEPTTPGQAPTPAGYPTPPTSLKE
jgi:hypothetical protein